MTFSVRDAVELPIIQQGQPEVLAGVDRLDRPIRWVHIADIREIGPLLKGGELLLTSGLGLGTDREDLRAYVRQLEAAGVAGIVLTLGWAYPKTPPVMVDEAARLGLPLVVLHRSIPFVEVTEQVHSAIIGRQLDLLQRAEALGRRFTSLVLRGGDIRAVAEILADLVDGSVFVEDVSHRLVDFVERPPGSAILPGTWQEHVRTGHEARVGSFELAVEDGRPTCAWMSIPVLAEPWGRIHVLSERAPDEIDRLAIDRAAVAIALLLLSQRDAARQLERARGDLVASVLKGAVASEDVLHRRARMLGCDMTGRRMVALITDADRFAEHIRLRDLGEAEIQELKAGMVGAVVQAIEASGAVALTALDSDEVLCLVGIPSKEEVHRAVERIGKDIGRLLPEHTGLTATVGAGREAGGVAELARSFREAREALTYGKRVPDARGAYQYGDLGLDTLLLRLRGTAELSQYVESELGPLLVHDSGRTLKLLPTLQAFLGSGGNKTATAQALHIGRRSLYYRLERLSAVLGRDLGDAEDRARLHLAVRALAILGGEHRLVRLD